MLHSYDASIKKDDFFELTDYTPSKQNKFESEQGIQFPVVANFDMNCKKLHYFAAIHGSGESHPTLIKVQSLIEELKPDCLILEGFDNTPESIQNVTEYVGGAINHVGGPINLKTTSEPIYAAYLASKRNIPFVGGEPTNLEIQAHLNSKYTEEDFVFYNFINWIPCAARGGIKLNSISAYLEKYCYSPEHAQSTEKLIKDWLILKLGKLPDMKTLINSQFLAPIRGGNFIECMSQDIDDIRNLNILDRIDDSLKIHSNVLVIYGCSHYFQQFKILQKKYGTPTYDANTTTSSFLSNCCVM